ncbi:collagenase-like [Topomyia yanbarensis]|uniref:collagenase-like n=1 Tax=Topomyia yanbarensis TaxID=2498891 RepID=UPI00273C9963|nr:collagenase-like [Topomyia yanbarensis]
MKLFLALMAFVALSQAAQLRYQTPITMREAHDAAQKSHVRIVNGFPASPGQFPYQVFLIGFMPGGGALACGGSIISNYWILTAAHCIVGVERFEVSMGSIAHASPEVRGYSNNFIVHYAYNPNNLNNDIGLVRLNDPVGYSQNIQPVNLPSGDRAGESFEGYRATVSGFGVASDAPGSGVSPTKNWVNIRIISNGQCQGVYGPDVIVGSTICGLGADFDSQSTCSGDSGGPLTIDEHGSTQIGVVSFVSSAGCTSGHPSGYVRTTHFRGWINEHTGI